MMRRLRTTALITAAIGWGTPVTLTAQFWKGMAPQICSFDLSLPQIGLTRAVVNVNLDVSNPLPVHIVARRADLAVFAEGEHLLTVPVERSLTLRAVTVSRMTVPVAIEYSGIAPSAVALFGEFRAGRPLDFAVSGTITVNTPAGDIRLPVEFQKEVRLGEAQGGPASAPTSSGCGVP